MNTAAGTIPAMIASLADTSTIAADVRAILDRIEFDAITAALEGEDDPTLRERLDRVLDRVTKIEETLALLMDKDVEDVPMPPAEDPERVPVAAGFTEAERDDLADKGKARPDGSFPIENVADLHNAIRAFGRAKDKDAAKRWIKKRARELDAEGALPDSWD